jgi:capsular exopolysaccharide synthesis family protein
VIRPDRKAAKANRESGGGDLDEALVAHFSPQGRTAEAYRAVRTALYFTQGNEHKVIQVTSPHAGDGKTTLAANMAVCIAQSGKRTVLLEADFRRPRCHKLFGLDNTLGVTDAIAGNEEIMDVIQETGIKNLWAVSCGRRPDNPSELLTSDAFEHLLEVIKEKFDFVIVDTPPLLAVTDPAVVAPRVDGVLLVMRLTKSARRSAQRASEVLDSLRVNVVGVVVNGMDSGGRYGRYRSYGQYRYGGYGYGGYGYGQSEYSDKKYYREDRSSKNAGVT